MGEAALPWRCEDLDRPHPDPYAVLVSEVMLQQTQVATVVPFFLRWMARLPDLPALAAAEEDQVHGLWAGLGYYRRARNLRLAAGILARQGWPADLAGLLELPGLGPYTAAALAAQAFQWPTPALDGNAFRVAARLLALEGEPRLRAEALRAWLRPALEAHGPSRITQAIMELGATLCAPAPRCAACPLRAACRAHLEGSAHRIPPPGSGPGPRRPNSSCWPSLRRPGGCSGPRPPRGCWRACGAGPGSRPEPRDGAAEAARPYRAGEARAWPGWVQVYTHLRQTVHPLALRLEAAPPAPEGLAWVAAGDLAGLPMGKRDQRLRERLDQPAGFLPWDRGGVGRGAGGASFLVGAAMVGVQQDLPQFADEREAGVAAGALVVEGPFGQPVQPGHEGPLVHPGLPDGGGDAQGALELLHPGHQALDPLGGVRAGQAQVLGDPAVAVARLGPACTG